MCGDCIAATFMVCFGCCYGRRVGAINPAMDDDLAEAPRPIRHAPKQSKFANPTQAIDVPKKNLPGRVSAAKAHENLVACLGQPLNAEQALAMQRLHAAFIFSKNQLTPDFLTSATTNLDIVLFDSGLHGQIKVEWADLTVTPRRILRGISLPCDVSWLGITKIRIRLNKAILELDSKEEIWGTVIHEMLHAYLYLNCGWSEFSVSHHGSLFEASCEALPRKLGFDGFAAKHVV